jgi:hypothetical protein
MKDDEKRFLRDIAEQNLMPRDLINKPDFYLHHKRAWYLLGKWSNKGWYDYGVTLDLGWLTPLGKEVAEHYHSEEGGGEQ